jgi:hypothetical protein
VIGILAIAALGTPSHGQRPAGMMAMHGDSATMAEMAVIHELMRNHSRITRSVTNLSDGIRTVTESDDSVTADRIKQHVTRMAARVSAQDDPGLPMESAALRAIYRNGSAVVTQVDTTAKGMIVVQRSTDSATVAALQRHAAEVTELVRRGMAAMHDAMMSDSPGHSRIPHEEDL